MWIGVVASEGTSGTVWLPRKWHRYCSSSWQENPEFHCEDPGGLIKGTQSGTHRWIHHRGYHRLFLRIVELLEPGPIPFRFLREVAPGDSQGIRAVIPRIPRVTFDVLDLNRLTRSLTSFEEGEGVLDQIFVED